MMDAEENIKSEGLFTPTYFNYWSHIRLFTKNHLLGLIKVKFSILLVLIGLISIVPVFSPSIHLNNPNNYLFVIFTSFIIAFVLQLFNYFNHIPIGLENESQTAQSIARKRPMYWEHKIAFEILSNRIKTQSEYLIDIDSKKVHIPIKQIFSEEEYFNWMRIKFDNILNWIEVFKNIYVNSLMNSLTFEDKIEIKFEKIVHLTDVMSKLHSDIIIFEIESRQFKFSDEYNLLHEIQSEWNENLLMLFRQILKHIESVSLRLKSDESPIAFTLTISEPPRMAEFEKEFEHQFGHL